MNAKQSRFVLEYLKDLNATQAAIRAGYSKKTAGIQGHDLLKNPKISDAIRTKSAELAEKQEISVEWVLNGLKGLAVGGDCDKVRATAYQAIGKHLGMFREKVDLNVDGELKVSWQK